MKSWLICISPPLPGAEEYYGAYANENPEDKLNGLFNEVCSELFDSYSYLMHYEDDWEELTDEDKEENYGNDYENFLNEMYHEWEEGCSMSVSECPEEEFTDYTPNACEMEIVYDERV